MSGAVRLPSRLGAILLKVQGQQRCALASAAESIIAVDRSGLYQEQPHSHGPLVHKQEETPMVKHLKTLIRFRGGPITLAEYMSEVLTNSSHGYYMHRDVFGAAGDFTTSPEVSQLFGEMLGIWCLTVWEQIGRPPRLRLVELGPGRGTLMADLLRGVAPFRDFTAALSVQFVEVSEHLRRKQWATLGCQGEYSSAAAAQTAQGVQVSWHRSLADVPSAGPAVHLVHEFLDALPVHQFQRTRRGWRERLVDVAADDSPLHLRLVLAPGDTPASKLLVPRRLQGLPDAERDSLQQLEVSPQAMTTAEELARRTADQGGAALMVDYGRDAPYGASLQAIRQHDFVGLLDAPGTADLSAHVDFSALRQAVKAEPVACHGPVTQQHLLQSLGIAARTEALLRAATDDEEAERLFSGYQRLISGSTSDAEGVQEGSMAQQGSEQRSAPADAGMGQVYKAMAMTPSSQDPPVAFLQT